MCVESVFSVVSTEPLKPEGQHADQIGIRKDFLEDISRTQWEPLLTQKAGTAWGIEGPDSKPRW